MEQERELSTKEKARIAQREYMRKWRKRPGNKEKAKQYRERSMARKYDQMQGEG